MAWSSFRATAIKRLQLGLVAVQQGFIERFQVRVAANRNQSRHVECMAKMPVARTAYARRLMHRGPRDLVRRVETAMRHPLPHTHLRRQRSQLAQQLQRADRGDPRHAGQQIEPLRIASSLRTSSTASRRRRMMRSFSEAIDALQVLTTQRGVVADPSAA